jgi:YVTN family beta-propeller protein
MRKKIKLYALIASFLVLASCDESCDYYYFGQMNSGRYLYAWFAEGATGFPGSVRIIDPLGIVDVVVPVKHYDSSLWQGGYDAPKLPRDVSTSTKPPMWVVSNTRNSVYAVDSNVDTIIKPIPVGNAPSRAAIGPDNNTLYVTNTNSDSISVIDMGGNNPLNAKVTRTLQTVQGAKPTAIAVTADGNDLFVLNSALNSASKIDIAANKIESTFPVGQGPLAIAITPDGLLLFVANSTDNTVTVHDVMTTEKVKTITGIPSPTWIAFERTGQTAYITSAATPRGNLVFLRMRNYTVRTTVAVGTNPVYVATDTYGTAIYVANKGSNNVTVINSNDNSIAGTLTVAGAPTSLVSIP